MLIVQTIRSNPEHVRVRLAERLDDTGLIDKLLEADDRRKEGIVEQDDLRRQRNENGQATRKAGQAERQEFVIPEVLRPYLFGGEALEPEMAA